MSTFFKFNPEKIGTEFRIIFTILLALFNPFILEIFAQSKSSPEINTYYTGYLEVTGNVERNNKPLSNASIIVYESNKEVENKTTTPDGKFIIKLEFNKYYDVEITKSGLVTKKFNFVTYLPDSVNNNAVFSFEFTIVLFPKYKDIDMSILDKPLALIRYDYKYRDFFYDYNYAKSTNNEVILLQNKIEELTDEYSKCVGIGNNYFNSKQYKEALIKFKRAHDIFPDESYPVEKIQAIEKFLNNHEK